MSLIVSKLLEGNKNVRHCQKIISFVKNVGNLNAKTQMSEFPTRKVNVRTLECQETKMSET